MTGTPAPRVFLSHSHADKPVAEELDHALRRLGVDPWLDKWEIEPGDSLIQKIFSEGLAHCAVFLVLLSPESVASKWVREELDVALVRRLEGATRVVPVVVKACEIPMPLRALFWLDMASSGVEETARRVADVAHGRSAKPAVRQLPPPSRRVEGLSEHASSIAVGLAPALAEPDPRWIDGPALANAFNLPPEQVNDAVDELASLGLVKLHKALDTHPFDFMAIEATYALGHHLRGTGVLDYDPAQDILQVAAAVVALKHVNGEMLEQRLKIVPGRINQAVAYLDDYGHARVLRALGTAPFMFHSVSVTPATRRFVEQHGK